MKVMLENVRLSFPSLYAPKAFAEGQPAKFQASAIFPKDSDAAREAREAERTVATEKWGEKAKDVMKRARRVVRDGTDKDQFEGYSDEVYYIQASNSKRPLLLDRKRNAVAEEDDVFYPGCYVNMQVELWAQDNQYGKAVNAQLKAVQFVADGESFGGVGSPASAEDFPDLDGDSVDTSDWDDDPLG